MLSRYVLPPLLSLVGPSESERTAEIISLRRHAFAVFRRLKSMIGEDEARRVFLSIAKSRRGHPQRSRDQERDRDLLYLYRERAERIKDHRELKALPRHLGNELHQKFGRRYGNSGGAIAQQIRRVVKAEKDRAQASARNMRRLGRLSDRLGGKGLGLKRPASSSTPSLLGDAPGAHHDRK